MHAARKTLAALTTEKARKSSGVDRNEVWLQAVADLLQARSNCFLGHHVTSGAVGQLPLELFRNQKHLHHHHTNKAACVELP